MPMRYVLLIVLLAAGAFVALRGRAAAPSTAPTTQSSIPLATVEEFASLIGQPGHVLLDVRTPDEHAAGHIAGGSKVVDFESPDFAKQAAELPRDKTYLIYCRSGRRSHLAAGQMQALGFEHLVDLKGGILGWAKAGKPVGK